MYATPARPLVHANLREEWCSHAAGGVLIPQVPKLLRRREVEETRRAGCSCSLLRGRRARACASVIHTSSCVRSVPPIAMTARCQQGPEARSPKREYEDWLWQKAGDARRAHTSVHAGPFPQPSTILGLSCARAVTRDGLLSGSALGDLSCGRVPSPRTDTGTGTGIRAPAPR